MDLFSPIHIMGDSTAMTIEFLRARLLSERTVSKAAKERSEQLATRVSIFFCCYFLWLIFCCVSSISLGLVMFAV